MGLFREDFDARIKNKALKRKGVTDLEKENSNLSYEAALEGMVLLKNEGVLPLKSDTIALFGAGAASTIKGGTGSGEVNERHAVSIWEGLKHHGFTITTEPYLQAYLDYRDREEKAYGEHVASLLSGLNILKNLQMFINTPPFQQPAGQEITMRDIHTWDRSHKDGNADGHQNTVDTCIYVLSRQAGEGVDRRLEPGDYYLAESEENDLLFLSKEYAHVILVINAGGVVDLSPIDEIPNIHGIIYFVQEGCRGGDALAALIKGQENFSGKLAMTWARNYQDYPGGMDYSYLNNSLREDYDEGIFVGYRHFDKEGITPRYPFGYGLSYTDFSIEGGIACDGIVDASTFKVLEENAVQICVTNTGKHSGKEVVQLYVTGPQDAIQRAPKSLVSFAKTKKLSPGESQDLTLSVDPLDLAYYDEDRMQWILSPGQYTFHLGDCSSNTKVLGQITVEQELVLEVEPVDGSQRIDRVSGQRLDQKSGQVSGQRLGQVSGQRSGQLSGSSDLDRAVQNQLQYLSNSDKIHLVVGAGMTQLSLRKPYFEALGCAGNTTSKLLDKGIPNISLADGPAGLRLQKTSVVYANGKIKMIDAQMSLLNYFPSIAKKFMFGDLKHGRPLYQFTTSFPVGTALANSWNRELLERVGRGVSREMSAYGVTYWLAPGMNIQRNPLCGRNFEYYSEDPYLSGHMAAAICRGVQETPGNYATIKHFLCNNQETERNHTDAIVGERALREIYLKNFYIALRYGHPGGLMTSYNRVNGEYANNSKRLIREILREEWGYNGLIMTDWLATGVGLGDHAMAIAAGNDLIMPGSGRVRRALMKGLRRGVFSQEELDQAAGRVLRGVLSSQIYREYAVEQGKRSFSKVIKK